MDRPVKRVVFFGIIAAACVGFAIGLYGRALWDDGWPW